jgi:hypothetical protein
VLSSFLDKISGFFDKPFLVAAVLPILMVLLAILMCAASEFGIVTLVDSVGRVQGSTEAGIGAIMLSVIVVLAFALRTVRGLILAVWSGDHAIWELTGLKTALQRRQARKRAWLEEVINRPRTWAGAFDSVRNELDASVATSEPRPRARWSAQRATESVALPAIPDPEKERLYQRINTFRDVSADRIPERSEFNNLVREVCTAYRNYEKSSIEYLDYLLCYIAKRVDQIESLPVQTAEAELDCFFGPATTPLPTTLGNIIRALDAYPFTRYAIEGGVFWPHLQHVIKGDLREDVSNQRMLLDMCLALTSLFALLVATTVFLGPWLFFGYFWLLYVPGFVGLSWIFYRTSIQAALALSRAMRAAYDVFRFDLLDALGVRAPKDLKDEREKWERFSVLAAYGYGRAQNIEYKQEEASPEAG